MKEILTMAFDFNKLAEKALKKVEETKETLEAAKVLAKPLLEQAKTEAKTLKDDLVEAAKGNTPDYRSPLPEEKAPAAPKKTVKKKTSRKPK